ncbi:MAG: hypothetical protein AMXMBFR81_30850 [Chthonomonas sp.]
MRHEALDGFRGQRNPALARLCFGQYADSQIGTSDPQCWMLASLCLAFHAERLQSCVLGPFDATLSLGEAYENVSARSERDPEGQSQLKVDPGALGSSRTEQTTFE